MEISLDISLDIKVKLQNLNLKEQHKFNIMVKLQNLNLKVKHMLIEVKLQN